MTSPKIDNIELAKTHLAAARTNAEAIEQDNQHKLAVVKAELGFLGAIFGSHQNAPFYLAAIISILSLLALIGFLIWDDDTGKVELLSAILLGTLAFAFGRVTKG